MDLDTTGVQINNIPEKSHAIPLFTKRGRVESGTTGNKSKPEVGTVLEPGATACKPDALTTGPLDVRC